MSTGNTVFETKDVFEAAYLLTLPGVQLSLTPRVQGGAVFLKLECPFGEPALLEYRQVLVNNSALVEPHRFMQMREAVMNVIFEVKRGKQ